MTSYASIAANVGQAAVGLRSAGDEALTGLQATRFPTLHEKRGVAETVGARLLAISNGPLENAVAGYRELAPGPHADRLAGLRDAMRSIAVRMFDSPVSNGTYSLLVDVDLPAVRNWAEKLENTEAHLRRMAAR